ncbi:MAG: LysR family transcriptional regulator [Rhizobiales bacterium 63-7]|nr:LysR family transcriptional regulator [Hyphomicrobiales bacterium]OJU69027.1 MAG: LysR family transcriptional regulator [Rhizobiales bacterium 63-7]
MTKFEDLDVFARVVSLGSMSMAGRALNLSPAVVSKRIKRLEDRLGSRLLQRTTRQISLTEAGQGFYERVLSILAGIDEAESYVSGRSARIQGMLKVTAPTSFGRMHVAPHLKPFLETHPDLSLHMVLSDDFTDIVGGGYDLAIRIAELGDSSLVARKLAPVRRVLCATPDYIFAHGMPESVEDLRHHLCLRPHNNDVWKLEGPRGAVTYRPQERLITNSSEVIREAVLAGMGIALRSTWDIGPELKSGRLVRVLPELESSRNVAVFAVYPSRQFLPAKVRLFIDYLSALYSPVPNWER